MYGTNLRKFKNTWQVWGKPVCLLWNILLQSKCPEFLCLHVCENISMNVKISRILLYYFIPVRSFLNWYHSANLEVVFKEMLIVSYSKQRRYFHKMKIVCRICGNIWKMSIRRYGHLRKTLLKKYYTKLLIVLCFLQRFFS